MTRRTAAALSIVGLASLAWCVAVGAALGGDPMLVVEIPATTLVAAWAALVAQSLVASRRVASALSHGAHETSLFGVPVTVTPGLDADAVVVGGLRPVIYVGARLAAVLSDDEMRAVVLHEDHHRRTRAPLRAAAIAAWLRLLGRSERIRGLLLERLSHLETLADADAIRRGSSPSSLARALLKGDASPRPVSFAFAAERRVEHLLDRAAGIPVRAAWRVPYEWLPIVLLGVATLACHAGL